MTHKACSHEPTSSSLRPPDRSYPPLSKPTWHRARRAASRSTPWPSCAGWPRRPTRRTNFPIPAVIWWKAQLLRRWQAERTAAAPIERMRWVELAAGFASLAVFLVWQWQGLVNLAVRAIPAGLAAASATPQAVSPTPLVLLTLGAASIGAVVVAVLHRRLGST